MGFLGQIACAIGIHEWSAWYDDKEKLCHQKRICIRDGNCTKTGKRTNHKWGDWIYTSDFSCEQTRSCEICSESGKQTARHEYGSIDYYKENSCEIAAFCKRCRNEEFWGWKHKWGNWEYEDPDSCTQVRSCRRCSLGVEYKFPQTQDHEWKNLQDERICVRCKIRQSD